MRKSIKGSEEVYQQLLTLQRPRETFSELVARLLQAVELLVKVAPIIAIFCSAMPYRKPRPKGLSLLIIP